MLRKNLLIVSYLSLILFSSPLIVAAYSGSSDEIRETVLSFLKNVIGFSNCETVSFESSTFRMPDSRHYQTVVKIVIALNGTNFEILTTFVDNRFYTYDIDSLPNQFDGNKSFGDCLVEATRAVKRYAQVLNLAYCTDFADMIPMDPQNQSLIVENSQAILKASFASECSNYSDCKKYADLRWDRKISNHFVSKALSFCLKLSKRGFVTTLVDNLALYHVASTNIAVTKEEAISIARSCAESYANAHGQVITCTNASIQWLRDMDSSRGDDFAMYPVWGVMISFDKTNDEYVCGYEVGIWADTGTLWHQQPKGVSFSSGVQGSMHTGWPVLGAVVFLVLILPALCFIKRARKYRKRGNGK
jgi:hypothetical protein